MGAACYPVGREVFFAPTPAYRATSCSKSSSPRVPPNTYLKAPARKLGRTSHSKRLPLRVVQAPTSRNVQKQTEKPSSRVQNAIFPAAHDCSAHAADGNLGRSVFPANRDDSLWKSFEGASWCQGHPRVHKVVAKVAQGGAQIEKRLSEPGLGLILCRFCRPCENIHQRG